MQTLVPIGEFEAKAIRLLGSAGFEDLLELLARRPRLGRLVEGTGGLRKLRVSRPGTGKSGGTRVIYYFHNKERPILLLLIYAKASQRTLTARQKAQLSKHVDAIIKGFS
jgi:hypothetical protein